MLLNKANVFKVPIKQQNLRNICITSNKSKSFRQWYRDLWIPNTCKPPYWHFNQLGDPILRAKASEVPKDTIKEPEFAEFIDHMIKMLRKYNCVGIAAPQIGISLRIIVMEFKENLKEKFTKEVYEAREMSTLPLTVMINPTLKVVNYDKRKFLESCESVKGYSAEVERYHSVYLTGVDEKNNEQILTLKGWNARIAQHEMDHLDGKLYIDFMDRSTFHCTCWEVVNKKAGRVEIPFYK
uniref:Peptide deformylase n=1 Tax=Glossina brevipalpis TaxID=37001 RepID=A0A1A9WDV1_9MUSC